MLPNTSLHEFGEGNLMFVIFNNHVYHTKNASICKENYLSLCGLFFPLVKSERLKNIEERYIKKNISLLDNFKEEYLRALKPDENFLNNIYNEIMQNKNLYFFISEIIPIYIGKRELKENNITLEKKDDSILERILKGNFAVINKRIYPLYEVNVNSCVNINSRDYFFKSSEKTIEVIEKEFKCALKEKLKKEILEKIEQSEEIKEKLKKLNSEIRDVAIKKHIIKVGDCYEYGSMGYDSNLQRVYCIIKPHHNKTTNRNYKERQAAIAASINNQKLEKNFVILFRENTDSNFSIDRTSLCLGMNPKKYDNEGIVSYLIKAAENIYWNKACYG